MGNTGSTCDKIDKREILVVLEDNSAFGQLITLASDWVSWNFTDTITILIELIGEHY